MGREVASAVSRWCALEDMEVGCEITAVCDLELSAREWFRKIPTVRLLTADSSELLKKGRCGCGLCRRAALSS